MNKVMGFLFAEGNRKMVVSLIALAISVLTDKYGGGLSEPLLQAVVAIVGIFAGSNVAEHFSTALKLKYDTFKPAPAPVSVQAEEVQQETSGVSVEQVLTYAQQIAKDSTARFQAIEQLLAKQSNSIQGLVNHINGAGTSKRPAQQEV